MNGTTWRGWRVLLSGVLIVFGVLALGQGQATREKGGQSSVRFAAYDVFVDSGESPLGAWQVDVRAPGERNAGSVRIVGIEGGESEAYAKPPKYDPRAIQRDRVIIGAFSTLDAALLPTGRKRVARIHVRLEGPEGFVPEFEVTLETAATPLGAIIDGEVSIEKGARP